MSEQPIGRKKNTWIIGGTSGIGLATATLLAAQPDREVIKSGEEVDVRDPAGLESFIGAIHRPDEVVFSAGVNRLDFIYNTDPTHVFDVFDTNVFGFINVLRALNRARFRDTRIVAVTSDAAERPMRSSIAYCASKAALNAAIRVAAREMADAGWRVNGVAPGMTAPTGMSDYIDMDVPEVRGWTPQQAEQYELSQAVIKRRATPQEIAITIKYMLEMPDYVNGTILTANGGR